MDNATEFQEVATCFSSALRQRAKLQAAAMGRHHHLPPAAQQPPAASANGPGGPAQPRGGVPALAMPSAAPDSLLELLR